MRLITGASLFERKHPINNRYRYRIYSTTEASVRSEALILARGEILKFAYNLIPSFI